MPIAWATENLRVSLFSNAPVQMNDADWSALTGQAEAEARQAIPAGRVFSGRFEGAQLSMAAAATRADVILSSVLEPVAEPGLPSIGPWGVMCEKFVDFTSAWIADRKLPVLRIAFGAVLLFPVANRREAYGHLKDLLASVSINPDEMRDLVFRINWPTTSAVLKGLSINRITNWSALQLRTVQLTDPQTPATIQDTHALRLEIDHSTDEKRFQPFDGTHLVVNLYKELVELAAQNAARGEKP
jgi:hypothetical protein